MLSQKRLLELQKVIDSFIDDDSVGLQELVVEIDRLKKENRRILNFCSAVSRAYKEMMDAVS